MKKAIGYIMIGSLVLSPYVYACFSQGLSFALILFGGTCLYLSVLIGGLYLIMKGRG